MSPNSQPVVLPNRRGEKLFGIVHEPTAEIRDPAIVLLSPGIKNRVAPHRLYVKMAERLAGMGHRVLRFDFWGLGDSEGTVDEALLQDLYGSIQVGRYVTDTHDAVDWMRKTFGNEQFVVGGLCGGAITALLAAPGRRDFAGILALGIPVALVSSTIDMRAHMSAGQLADLRRGYLRKVLDPRAWTRLMTLQTDFRLLARSLSSGLRKKSPPSQVPVQQSVPDNANPLFPEALWRTLDQGCPVLLLFSEADRLYYEFQEKFLSRHKAMFDARAHLVDIAVIGAANHILTFEEMQEDFHSLVRQWLLRRYPAAARAGRPPGGASVLRAQ